MDPTIDMTRRSNSSGESYVTVTGFSFRVGRGGAQGRVKSELGEKHPAALGLRHEESLADAVLKFVDNMMTCSERELDRFGR